MTWEAATFCTALFLMLATPLLFFKGVWSNRAANILALLWFASMLVFRACEYARGHWQFGTFGMPVEVVGPDGRHLDGSHVESVTLALHRSGSEEGALLFMIGLCIVFWWLGRRTDPRRNAR